MDCWTLAISSPWNNNKISANLVANGRHWPKDRKVKPKTVIAREIVLAIRENRHSCQCWCGKIPITSNIKSGSCRTMGKQKRFCCDSCDTEAHGSYYIHARDHLKLATEKVIGADANVYACTLFKHIKFNMWLIIAKFRRYIDLLAINEL